MLLVPIAEPIPLVTDATGVVRISKTRVTLDTVVTTFLEGAIAECSLEGEWEGQVRFLPLR
jgi:hypothetical protein